MFMACSSTDSPPVKPKKNLVKKHIEDEVQKKRPSSIPITNKNVEERLLKYGQENPETLALVKTDFGDIKIRLYEDTPLHRASFLLMAKNDCFNNIVFTRVAKDFMAQAGGTYDEKVIDKRNEICRYTIPSEINFSHFHKKGAVGAARSYIDNPDKRSSPFNFYFVEGSLFNKETLDNYENINSYTYPAEHRRYYMENPGAAHIDGQHTVFGEVIEGIEIISKLTSVAKDSRDWPKTDIFIREIIILE